jgi:LCP family protein required for cell wall assembly
MKKNLTVIIVLVVVMAAAGTAFAFWRGIQARVAQASDPGNPGTDSPADGGVGELQPRINVLLLGVDRGQIAPGEYGATRSDSMIILSVDPNTKQVSLISIPRDSKVPIAGHGEEKITHAHAYGGIPLAIDTVEKFFDIKLDYYVEVDTKAFPKLVDYVGGLDINVKIPMHYHDPYQNLYIDLEPGQQHLNGEKVEEYSRYRGDGDEMRMERQREVLMLLAKKILDPARIDNLPGIATTLMGMVKTNVTPTDVTRFLPLVKGVDLSAVHTEMVPGTPGVGDDGLWYWLVDEQGKNELFQQYVWATGSADITAVQVTVLNGTDKAGLASSASQKLESRGFTVASYGDAETKGIKVSSVKAPEAQIEAARSVAAALEIHDIIKVPDDATTPGTITVTLGEDMVR